MPKFSVIIPLFNKAAYIKATLESVLAQTFTDYEVIVADDGSTDGSGNTVKAFTDPRIKYYRNDNGGASAARNFAMEKAAGDYFAFLDADDIWLEYHLEKCIKAIEAMPHIFVFASLLKMENAHGAYMPVYSNLTNAPLQENDFFTLSYGRTVLSSSTAVIHRSVASAIGQFDVALKTAEDTDYWIRIGMNYRIGVINRVTARQTYVPESLSNSKYSIKNSTFFEKFAAFEKLNPAAKKMIDINRHSLALRCKMAGDKEAFNKMVSLISPASLSVQQKILITLPGAILRLLQKIKAYSNTIF